MDSSIVSASSVPCLAKKDVENNCSTRPKHEIKTKHPGMASEPLLPLVNSNAEKSEETITECCQSTGGKDITTACKDTHLLSQRKGGSLSSLEYYFFCSQSGPVVKEKGHDGRKAAGESRSQSLQVLNSCASSSASTSQLPVNLCDNLTETTSIVTPKAKYQGSKSLEEQSIASDLSKGTELRESCGLMCRICHSGFEEGELIRPCKCTGTVKHAHQSCILNWVSKSGNQNCELCKFKFRTRKESVKCFWKWRFPEVSTKGWLHIGLFIAFATMLLTSITWIIWSRVSRTPSAIAERTTEEVKFAYMVNGLFIALAVGGLYFDSLKHFKQYSKRWSALNQNVIVECYVSDNENKVEGIGVPCTSDKHHQPFVSMAVEETEMGRLSNKPGNNHRNDPEAWV